MELPARLREAIDRALEDSPLASLRQAAAVLSARYRGEVRDGRQHLGEAQAVQAYLAARMPATYAAVRASMTAVADALPAFRPATLLDTGAGPGTVLWAAMNCWPDLDHAVLVEASAQAQIAGRALASEETLPATVWRSQNIVDGLPGFDRADLVTLCYVLDELGPASLAPLVTRLWALTTGVLLIVEPGTPAGWRRILQARDVLIAAGARIVAPCPHAAACPLSEPDWCHFSQRIARSRLHRMTKQADVPWEDEKFIYVAAARLAPLAPSARVLAAPRQSSGKVELKLCCSDGSANARTVTRRDGALYKAARRLDWGDAADFGADD